MGYKFINTCSQCQCPMEVDSDWIGQNIQCPRCGNAFTVNAPQMQQAPVPPQAPQMQQAPVPPQMQFPPPEQQNKNTASLVLGILGLVFCGGIGFILSLVGLIIGCQKKYKTGIILGAIGIAINIIMAIAIIFALLLPALDALNAARESARTQNCISNLKHIGLGIAMYADSNKSYTPSGKGKESLDLLLDDGYLPNSFKFKCPSSDRSESYAYIGEKLVIGRDDPGLPVVLDYAGNHKNTVNVCYLGGHVYSVQVPSYCTTVEDVAKHVMENEGISCSCSDSYDYSRKCSYCQVLENARQY